ncbi:MAG TPA: OFA family MFS transporter [Oscillospiraceae bacterium]|nr:OFA family MFS transporter [Oscillospiraceae bacterium]
MLKEKRLYRWIPVFAGIVIQLCLGTAYIWGVFQKGVAIYLFNGSNADAGLAFSILLGVLTLGSTIGGFLEQKYSPRPVVIIGGVILAIGFFLASKTTPENGYMIWITYGIIGGFGMGMTYSTTIACCQRWFPDKRGFITGIIVSALGFGGVVFTPLAEYFIKTYGNGTPGIGELVAFKWFSVIFLIVCVIGGMFVKNPPKGFTLGGDTPAKVKKENFNHDFTPLEALKTPQFYALTVTLLLACMAGLMMIAFGKTIADYQESLKSIAVAGVMAVTLFNSFGRLFWGFVSDKIGRKNTILILLISTMVLVLLVKLVVSSVLLFVLIALIGFLYGGYLGTFPAITADYFGAKNVGMIYGMVLLGFGIGAVAASYIGGYFLDAARKADPLVLDMNILFIAFVIASVASGIGAVILYFVKQPKLKR